MYLYIISCNRYIPLEMVLRNLNSGEGKEALRVLPQLRVAVVPANTTARIILNYERDLCVHCEGPPEMATTDSSPYVAGLGFRVSQHTFSTYIKDSNIFGVYVGSPNCRMSVDQHGKLRHKLLSFVWPFLEEPGRMIETTGNILWQPK